MTRPQEIYACLYAREFPAQARLRLQPELQEKPCVVMEGAAPSEVVCSLNAKARLLGVHHGMTRVEVETFTGLVVQRRSLRAERAAKAVLLECAGVFSPRVEDCCEGTSFLCGIDISGTQSLFGPPEMLAKSLLQRVRALGISARITTSSNFYTAICLARGLSLRMATQFVAAGKEAEALASLPIHVLDLTGEQAETFAAWGIDTLGKLAALPEKQLIARTGQAGKRLRDLACGRLPHLFLPVEQVLTLEERVELDFPLEDLESLLFGLATMLEQLILRAKARIVALASVSITLELDGGGTHTRTVRPALPSNEKHLWLKLLHLDLEAHPPQAAIVAVLLYAEPGSTSKVQLGLFSPQLPEPGRLDITLARIAALVGEGQVGCAVLEDSHRMDAFRIEPFTVPTGDSHVIAAAGTRAVIRTLRPPEPITLTLQNGRPSRCWFRGKRYEVEDAYGPWLVSGDWWSTSLWGQEQWDLIARSQGKELLCCCVLHDLLQDQWRMVALYD